MELKMFVWRAAFLVLLVAVPGFAMAPKISDAPEQDDDEVAAVEEPPMDNEDDGYEPEQQTTPEQLKKLHAYFDNDADGQVSMSEIWNFSKVTQKSIAAKEAAEEMPEMDGDKDGKLSLGEILKSHYGEAGDEEVLHKFKARDGEKFKAADTNNDGFLDLSEFSSFSYPMLNDDVLQTVARHTLQDQDEDKDGFLTVDEFSLEETGETSEEYLETFKKLDTDGSGKLDEQELLPWESGHFHKKQDMENFMQLADTNSDQHVTWEELNAVQEEDHGAEYHFDEMIRHYDL